MLQVYERSSIYSPISRVRKFGSYLYEDFMPTDGQDVKVYTIGLHYAHAEARKSPVSSTLMVSPIKRVTVVF